MNPKIKQTFQGPPEIPYGAGSDMNFLCWSSKIKQWEVISAARFWGFYRDYPFWCYYPCDTPLDPTEEEQQIEENKWLEQESRGLTY